MITVVGSANLDVVVEVDRHPRTGETVLGGDTSRFPGGKGANQAVAASRLGGPTAFVGCIGSDAAGTTLAESLVEAAVDTSFLRRHPDRPSGMAFIAVDRSGDNTIVVSPGANHAMVPDDVEIDVVREATVVLTQLETPLDTVVAAARTASGTVVLDPAPMPTDGLPTSLLAPVDVLIPNETELALLTGVDTAASPEKLAQAARSIGPSTVIVTLGARGALVISENDTALVPSPSITAVDTTGAGDAFRAAVAVGLAEGGHDLVDIVRQATRVGAATALRQGAQPSLPTSDEVDELLP